MVEFAKEKKLRVIAANAPGRYSNLAGRKGQQALQELPSSSKNWFAPVPYDTATGAYYEKLAGLSHTPTGKKSAKVDTVKTGPAMMPGFNLNMGQSLWDTTMAWSISEYYKANKEAKIMQVNGKFHSDEGFGIATHLKKYSPGIRMLIISSGPAEDFPVTGMEQCSKEGDYIIISDPAVPRTFR